MRQRCGLGGGGAQYDCVIGVSGGKDSTFQAVYMKEKYGMHPLLVNSAPNEITDIGRYNLTNLSNMGFDIISLLPDPLIAKKLAREGFYKYGNIVKASEYALWSSAYDIAFRYNIPLVIEGENDAFTLGTAGIQEESGDAFGILQADTLQGDIMDWCGGIDEKDLAMYQVTNLNSIKNKGIKGIFLQYYAREWSYIRNMDFAVARGLKGRSDDLHDIGRIYRYASLDSDLVIANQMIKYLKFGFGFATDEVCYAIREGRMTREEGIKYIEEYDGKCSHKYIAIACDYMGIEESEFWTVVDRYVNRDLFEKKDGTWSPKFRVGTDYDI